jgi:CCR4-NOT transcription complex subunit 1
MVPEQVILLLVQDNLDGACEAIEKAAMDRAVADVDEGLSASVEARRRHREVIFSYDIIKIFMAESNPSLAS